MLIYLSLLFLLGTASGIANRKCAVFVLRGKAIFEALCVMQTAVIACVFFYCMAGFSIVWNPLDILFGFLYSFICMASLIFTLYAVANFSVVEVTVFRDAGGICLSFFLGILCFSEKVAIGNLIRLVFMLLAVFCIYFEQRRQKTDTHKDNARPPIIFLCIPAVIAALNTIFTKFYTLRVPAGTENSFFFFTNMFAFLFGGLAVVVILIKTHPPRSEISRYFLPGNLCITSSNTILNNLSSLVSLALVGMFEVSLLIPLTSALGILSSVLASVLMKQRCGKFAILAVLISILSIVLYAVIP